MASLNIKIPDSMEAQIDAHLQDSNLYLNRSEFIRDAIRHELTNHPPSTTSLTHARTHGSDVFSIDDINHASPEQQDHMRIVERYIRDLRVNNPAGAPHDQIVSLAKDNEGLSEDDVESAIRLLLHHNLVYEALDGKYQMTTAGGDR